MTTIINGSSPSITFSDSTTQTTAGVPLTGGNITGDLNVSGNVGIGTTSPANKLHVYTTATATPLTIETNGSACYLNFRSTSSSTGFIGYGEGGTANMNFYTANTERMRIDSSGAILMGKTAVDDSTAGFAYRASNYISVVRSGGAPCYFNRLTSTGTIVELAYNSATKGTISTDGSNVAYNTSSDYRLKENIVDLPNALTTISQLKPRQFDWKETSKTTTGFIAHELSEVMPQAVTGEKDAVDEHGNPQYQGIDTSFLVATLTAAIQELNAKVDAQATEIAELKAKP